MEEIYPKNQDEFTYELEAFLGKARSVPDFLLEDFNIKYSLGIGLEEYMDAKRFKKRAKQFKNTEALKFINWYGKKMSALKSDPIGKLFFDKRRVSMHRKTVKPDHTTVNIVATISLELVTQVFDKNGNLVTEHRKPPKQQPKESPKINLFFSEYDKENVLEASNKFLDMMRLFVEKAKKTIYVN